MTLLPTGLCMNTSRHIQTREPSTCPEQKLQAEPLWCHWWATKLGLQSQNNIGHKWRNWTKKQKVGEDVQRQNSPMAFRACLSSRVNAAMGTSSHTGRTATVERLLAGLLSSELEAMPRPEPKGKARWSPPKHVIFKWLTRHDIPRGHYMPQKSNSIPHRDTQESYSIK